MKKIFNNANELIRNSKEAKEFYLGLDEKSMGTVMLYSANIKSIDDMKNFIKRF